MPRGARAAQGGYCYHILNRGNARRTVFHKDGDFAAFIKLLRQAGERADMRLLAYCLMPNHFHLAVWQRRDGDLSDYMMWLLTAHVRRYPPALPLQRPRLAGPLSGLRHSGRRAPAERAPLHRTQSTAGLLGRACPGLAVVECGRAMRWQTAAGSGPCVAPGWMAAVRQRAADGSGGRTLAGELTTRTALRQGGLDERNSGAAGRGSEPASPRPAEESKDGRVFAFPSADEE